MASNNFGGLSKPLVLIGAYFVGVVLQLIISSCNVCLLRDCSINFFSMATMEWHLPCNICDMMVISFKFSMNSFRGKAL